LILYCITIPLSVKLNNISYIPLLIGWIGESTWPTKWLQLKRNKHILLLVVYYFFSVLTLFYSENFLFGRQVLESQIKLLIFPVILASASSLTAQKIRQIKVIWILFIVSLGLGLLFYAYLQYQKTNSTDFFFYHELTDPLFNLNAIYFANYLALAALFIIFLEVDDKRKNILLKVVGVTFIVILIFLLSALSVIVFTLFIALVLTNRWLSGKIGFWRAQIFNLAMLGILLVIGLSIPYTRGKITRATNLSYKMDYPDSLWNSSTIRLASWKCGLDVARKNVMLGTGVGDEMDDLFTSYRENNFKEGLRCEYNLHNQYLSTFLIGGIPLTIMLLIIFWLPLRAAIRKKDFLIIGFISLVAITLLTENFLRLHKGVSFFSFFYSLLLIGDAKKN
jgi:O-antigen ligase